MENKTVYDQRLNALATHISELEIAAGPKIFKIISISEIKGKQGLRLDINIHNWLFELFSEMHKEIINSESTEEIENEAEIFVWIMDFFGLDIEMFCHLFSLDGYQEPEIYGGQKLDGTDNSAAIANNIFAFINNRI